MEVKTKSQGTVEVPEERLVTMPRGLFGFELYTEFALVESEYQPFWWLQSLQDRNLAFLLIDPFIICRDYEIDIDDASLSAIDIGNPSDVFVMAIVTVPHDGGPITANFQGPVVFNRKNRRAMQAVSGDGRWTTKFDIVAALRAREASC